MTNYKYKLKFLPEVLSEWKKTDKTIKEAFRKMLRKRLDEPRRPNQALSGLKDCYKLKLRKSGFRLIYYVRDSDLIVTVLTINKREDNIVYDIARNRLPNMEL